VLTHEAVSKARHFDEQGYRGTILPIPQHGSIAVLMRAPGTTAAEVDAIAAQVAVRLCGVHELPGASDPTTLMFDSLQSIASTHGLLPYDRHDQNICLDHRVRPGQWGLLSAYLC